MKITAICKAFNGEDWIPAMLRSILPFVDRVVLALPAMDWKNRRGNKVEGMISSLAEMSSKIYSFRPEGSGQARIYQEMIAEAGDYDYLMAVDADEAWDEWALKGAIGHIQADVGKTAVFCSQMVTYIKSPFYRIRGFDPCQPVVFVRRGVDYQDIRWAPVRERRLLPGVYFHHFSAVRRSLAEVVDKFQLSNTAEKMRPVNADIWVNQAWNNLPRATNINPNTELANIWPAVEVVKIEDLPAACRDLPIVRAFQNYPMSCNYKEIPPALLKKYNLPPDFGPSHQLFRAPSYRTRYSRALEELRSS